MVTTLRLFVMALYLFHDFSSITEIIIRLCDQEKVLPHGFKEGMKIEAADLMDPRLICVATVGKGTI